MKCSKSRLLLLVRCAFHWRSQDGSSSSHESAGAHGVWVVPSACASVPGVNTPPSLGAVLAVDADGPGSPPLTQTWFVEADSQLASVIPLSPGSLLHLPFSVKPKPSPRFCVLCHSSLRPVSLVCTEQPCCMAPAAAGSRARTTPATDSLRISKNLKSDIIQIFALISLTQVEAGFSSTYITDKSQDVAIRTGPNNRLHESCAFTGEETGAQE